MIVPNKRTVLSHSPNKKNTLIKNLADEKLMGEQHLVYEVFPGVREGSITYVMEYIYFFI